MKRKVSENGSNCVRNKKFITEKDSSFSFSFFDPEETGSGQALVTECDFEPPMPGLYGVVIMNSMLAGGLAVCSGDIVCIGNILKLIIICY
jgi:hypothetical protein